MMSVHDTCHPCYPVHVFSQRIIPEEILLEVIRAGSCAPYPYPEPVHHTHLRKFFVFRTGTSVCETLEQILKRAIETSCDELISFFGWRAYTPEGPGSYIQLLKNFETTGIPSFRSAPWIIIITEERRFPPVEQESLAFVVSHLWMAAVTRGLGVHLLPGISYLSRRSEFFTLVNLPPGKYAVTGVAVGYPHESLEEKENAPDPYLDVSWL